MLSHITLPSAVVLLCFAASTLAASGLSYNGLAQTPQMGWDTYNAYGLDYNETTIRLNAGRLVSLGFRDLGYRVIVSCEALFSIGSGMTRAFKDMESLPCGEPQVIFQTGGSARTLPSCP